MTRSSRRSRLFNAFRSARRRGSNARRASGNSAELAWWHEYVAWGTDNQVPAVMTEAFDWLRTPPTGAEPSDLTICWGDARLSNAIFDDAGQIVGALDWEQACLCPAETDFGWWLATRRQMLEVNGVEADPELPGFDSREQLIRRYEEMIGRALVDLGLVRDLRDGADGMLHLAHAGPAAQHRAGRPFPHPGTDPADVDHRRSARVDVMRDCRS